MRLTDLRKANKYLTSEALRAQYSAKAAVFVV